MYFFVLEGADYADSGSTKESTGSHEKGILLSYDREPLV